MRPKPLLIGVITAGLLMAPAVVSAHAYELSLDCGGVHVSLRGYQPPPQGQRNTVTVFVDGDQRYQDSFDADLSRRYEVGHPSDAHQVRVEVRAWDDDNGPDQPDPSWSFDWTDHIGACAEPTPSPTPKPEFTAFIRTPICDGDVPWLRYEVAVQGTKANRVTITFLNPDGPDVVYPDLPLKGRVLWPGAVIDKDGNPVDWPGWRKVNGVWVEGDEWDWVLPSVRVQFEVDSRHVGATVGTPSSPNCSPPTTHHHPEPTPPAVKPDLKLPPTDAASDLGLGDTGRDGGSQGPLFLILILAAVSGAYVFRAIRRQPR